MPVREFDIFRINLPSIQKKPIKILQNENLIIDGFWFIKVYMTPSSYKEHLLNGLKMEPLHKLIKMAEKLNINLLWIWDGIKPKKSLIEGSFNIDCYEKALRDHSSRNYKNVDRFYQRALNNEEYVLTINNFLRKYKTAFIRAPYYAMAQAVYLQRNLNSYFFGPTDFLMFEESEKVITDLYLEEEMVRIVNKIEILESNRIDYMHFQGICLILGSEFCSTIPYYAKDFNAKEIISHMCSIESIYSFITRADYEEKEFYINQYICAVNMLKHCPVMTTAGMSLLTDETNKCDLDLIFGIKLSDFLYEKLFVCEISAEILEGMAFGEIKERFSRHEKPRYYYYSFLKNSFDFDIRIKLKGRDVHVLNASNHLINSKNEEQSQKLLPNLNKVLSLNLKVLDHAEPLDQILMLLIVKDEIFKSNLGRKVLCFNKKTEYMDCYTVEISQDIFNFCLEFKYITLLYYNIINSIELILGCKSMIDLKYNCNNALKTKLSYHDFAFLENIKKLFKLNIEYLGSDFYINEIENFILQQK